MIIRNNDEWHTLSYVEKINYYYSIPSRIRPYFDLFKVTLPAVGNLRATVYEAIQDNKETIGHFCGRTGIDFQELNRFLHYGKMDDSLYQQIIGGLNLPDTNDYRRYISDNFTKQEKLYCFVLEALDISEIESLYKGLISTFVRDYIEYLSKNESLTTLKSETVIEKMYDLITLHDKVYTFQSLWKILRSELSSDINLLELTDPNAIKVAGLILQIKLKQYMRLSEDGTESEQSNLLDKVDENLSIKQEVNSTYKISKQYILLVVLTILLKGFMLYVVVNPPFDTAGSTYLFMLSLIGLTFFIDVNIGSLPMYRKDDKNEKL